jgi:hypothetical protein
MEDFPKDPKTAELRKHSELRRQLIEKSVTN